MLSVIANKISHLPTARVVKWQNNRGKRKRHRKRDVKDKESSAGIRRNPSVNLRATISKKLPICYVLAIKLTRLALVLTFLTLLARPISLVEGFAHVANFQDTHSGRSSNELDRPIDLRETRVVSMGTPIGQKPLDKGEFTHRFSRRHRETAEVKQSSQRSTSSETPQIASNSSGDVIVAPERTCQVNEDSEPMTSQQQHILKLLSRHYDIDLSARSQMGDQQKHLSSKVSVVNQEPAKAQLPRPMNVSLFIISYYPPILELRWELNELSELEAKKLNFYEQRLEPKSQAGNNRTEEKFADDQFDLELALSSAGAGTDLGDIEPVANSSNSSHESLAEPDTRLLLSDLRRRKLLVRKSLTCFQVTYNIINSRFKVTEEYPPYLSSIMLERLLPATQYSLRVIAIYLGRYKRLSDRVQFTSPTDNESRRFKENTYRPIHHYPDEKREPKIGLAQVRGEELTIVAIALVFWVATICLFFNKWGKIRMLEPYQPSYREATGSAAASFTHHHPSMQNLHGSTGAPMSGSVSALATCQPAGDAVSINSLAAATAKTVAGTLVGIPPMSLAPTAKVPPLIGNLTGGNSLDSQHYHISAGSSVTGAPVARATSESTSRKQSSKSGANLLRTANKRFDTIATDDFVSTCSPITATNPRVEAELSLRFQAKALALARATSLWTRQQQEKQKLRQQQQQQLEHFKARLAGSTATMLAIANPTPPAPEPPVIEQVDQRISLLNSKPGIFNETLLVHRLQTNKPKATGGLGNKLLASQTLSAGSVDYSGGPEFVARRSAEPAVNLQGPASGGSEQTSCAAADAQDHFLQRYNKINNTCGLESGGHLSYNPFNCLARSLDTPMDGSGSLLELRPHSMNSSEPGANERSAKTTENASSISSGTSANKLRRLQFMNKLHQHHHIATSSSSSQLMNNQLDTSAHNKESNSSSVWKINSLSLDRDNRICGTGSCASSNIALAGRMNSQQHQQQHNSETIDQTKSDEFSSNCIRGSQLSTWTDAANASSTTTSAKTIKQTERLEEMQTTSLRAPVSSLGIALEVGVGVENQTRGELRKSVGHKVEHHILIEPPSPPNKRVLEGRVRVEAPVSERLAEDLREPHRARSLSGGSNSKPMDDSRLRETTQESRWSDKCKHHQTGEVLPSCCCSICDFKPQEASQWPSISASGKPETDAFAKLAEYQQQHYRQQQQKLHRNSEIQHLATSELHSLAHMAKCGLCSSKNANSSIEYQRRRLHSACGVSFGAAAHPSISNESSGSRATTCIGYRRSTEIMRHGQSCVLLSEPRIDISADTSSNTNQDDATRGDSSSPRPRQCSVFVASPYARVHRDSFAMLRALSQKKSKSAEDVAYLSSLVLQIWARDRNPLLQSVSQQHLSNGADNQHYKRRQSHQVSSPRQQSQTHTQNQKRKGKSSLTVGKL